MKSVKLTRCGHYSIADTNRCRWRGVALVFSHEWSLAYVEVLPDERRWSITGFLVRALRWFRERGVRVEQVMTDNGSGNVARLFRKVLRMLGHSSHPNPAYTLRTNGKAERAIQTLLREWAYAIPFKSSDRRVADLPRWLARYNQQRSHASLAKRTPAQAPRRNNLIRIHS